MYIVLEIQKSNGQIATLVTTHETLNEAESKYYTILSYAAVSNLELHGAALLNEDGGGIRSQSYHHEVTTE